MRLVNVATGADYALTRRESSPTILPKRFAAVLSLNIAGVPTEARVTTNAGFAAPENVLSYPFFYVGGFVYYVTLGPGESLDVGAEYVTDSGVAKRKNPARVPARPEVEANRIALFKTTYAGNRAVPVVETKPLEEALAAPVEMKKKKSK